MSSKSIVENLLSEAGIKVNGPNDFDMQVYNEKTYDRFLSGGSMALGESYMDAWWDAKSLDKFFDKVLSAKLDKKINISLSDVFSYIRAVAINLQSKSRAFQVAEKHYNIGNDLYESMLGRTMAYSCAYFKDTDNLDEAQEAKLDLICRKIGLKKGDTVLDIGCGWGSFLKFAAEHYGISGVGTTVSKEQASLARERCKNLPIEIRLEDYRNTKGKFDHIVSVGMFEHVGSKNYSTFFKKVHELMKDGGMFLLHTIGFPVSGISIDPWIEKYIFPNSMLPSIAQIAKSAEGLFVMEDWHNFGAYYDKTLMAWSENFEKIWPKLKEKYGERFYRMWKYYLMICAGSFRSRKIQLWQVVFSKEGVPGGYIPVR